MYITARAADQAKSPQPMGSGGGQRALRIVIYPSPYMGHSRI